MKIEKTDINYLVKNKFTWTFLNFSLNLLGLWMSKLLDKAGFNYLESISNEFVKPILIQSAIFAVVTLVAYIFLRNKKLTLYIFTLVQLLAFHAIFFLNLSSEHMLHFETRIDDNGLKYLSNMGQYFIDILYLYVPAEGIFKGNVFIPRNTGLFYFQWIFLVLLYFAGVTWLTAKTVRFFFGPAKTLPAKTEQVTTEALPVAETETPEENGEEILPDNDSETSVDTDDEPTKTTEEL